MKFLLGSYYFLKLKPIEFGVQKGNIALTGSYFINNSYFDAWSLSWTQDGKNDLSKPMKEFNLSDSKIKEIQTWADLNFDKGNIGWPNTFSNLDTLLEYKNKFFHSEKNSIILSLYIEESEAQEIITDFTPNSNKEGAFGIWSTLKKTHYKSSSSSEVLVGYDLIELDLTGSFHSFLSNNNLDLDNLNEHGLIKNIELAQKLRAKSFSSPDWNLVKVKIVNL